MKLQDNLRLRKIGRKYMVVHALANQKNKAEVFALNEVAAQMWQYVEGRDFTQEELVEWLCGEYEVEPAVAKKDVERQLEEWKSFGLID